MSTKLIATKKLILCNNKMQRMFECMFSKGEINLASSHIPWFILWYPIFIKQSKQLIFEEVKQVLTRWKAFTCGITIEWHKNIAIAKNL
jgi:hypothetical protein